MRSLGQILHSTRDDRLGLAEFDHLCRGDNRLNSRAAQAVECQHGNLMGDTCIESGMARSEYRLVTGLECVPHDYMID
jgi:hypothetical protein